MGLNGTFVNPFIINAPAFVLALTAIFTTTFVHSYIFILACARAALATVRIGHVNVLGSFTTILKLFHLFVPFLFTQCPINCNYSFLPFPCSLLLFVIFLGFCAI